MHRAQARINENMHTCIPDTRERERKREREGGREGGREGRREQDVRQRDRKSVV